MKTNLQLIFKGFVIGIGKIIPGVSGAILAIMLNVYEPALDAIANLKKNIFNNLKLLAMLGIGIILAIILGSNIVLYFLEHYFLQTMALFLGLMLSGTIPILKEVKTATFKDKMLSLLLFVSLFSLSFINFNTQDIKVDFHLFQIIMYFMSGIIDVACSIIPGISGTAFLMLIGTYESILHTLGNMLTISYLFKNLYIILPFFSGIIIGGYFISKMVNYCFKKYHMKSYCCILSFSFFSIALLIQNIITKSYTLVEFLYSLLFLIFGFLLSHKMNNR